MDFDRNHCFCSDTYICFNVPGSVVVVLLLVLHVSQFKIRLSSMCFRGVQLRFPTVEIKCRCRQIQFPLLFTELIAKLYILLLSKPVALEFEIFITIPFARPLRS